MLEGYLYLPDGALRFQLSPFSILLCSLLSEATILSTKVMKKKYEKRIIFCLHAIFYESWSTGNREYFFSFGRGNKLG